MAEETTAPHPGEPPVATGTAVEHQAGEHKAFPPFDSSTFSSQLVWLAITFAVLYWLMAKVVIPRIGGILANRRDRIDGDLAAAEKAKAGAEAAEADYDKALATARTNASAIAEKAREEARAVADKERATVEASLATRLAEAEKRIGDIKARAMSEVGGIAADATGAIVQRLLGAEAGPAAVTDAVAKVMAK
jgi:F-type H+-transporting ATPase subunit b